MSGDRRIQTRGVINRGNRFTVRIDDHEFDAFDGETVATILYANRQRTMRYTPRSSRPRGLYCGMGVCFDCLVEIDGQPNVRACTTPASPGMRVRTQYGPSDPVSPVPDWGD